MLLCIILLTACSSTESLQIGTQASSIGTAIEGSFHSKEFFTERSPSLVIKDDNDWRLKILKGVIVKADENGVVFDEFQKSPFVDPPEKLYKPGEFVCAIGWYKELVAGELPDKYSEYWDIELQIRRIDKPGYKPKKFRLLANQKFSYSIEPGEYSVEKIKFKSHKRRGPTSKWEDEGINIPPFVFNATKGFSNYIGDIYLDFALPDKPNVYAIPFKWRIRDNYREPFPSTKDIPGGPNSSLFLVDNQGRITKEVHTIQVKIEEDFKSSLGLPLRKAPLGVERKN